MVQHSVSILFMLLFSPLLVTGFLPRTSPRFLQRRSLSTLKMSASKCPGKKYKYSWQQTMFRIKDPKVTVPFYEKNFGMKCVHRYDFEEFKFSLYFMETVKETDKASLPSEVPSKESEKYLWNMKGTTLELTHNWGSEDDAELKMNNGNEEPNRGFGHVAFNCDDVYKSTETLLANGVQFRKKPDEGRMKGIAFALDPDGYWIELVKRSEKTKFPEEFNLSQTMIRVKDPQKSLAFYRDVCGMSVVRVSHHNDFSLYFLACLEEGQTPPEDLEGEDAREFCKCLWQPVLELTHNHGTEKDEEFKYHNGNDKPQGFGHTGFLVDDLEKACAEMEELGVPFKKKPQDGKMRGLAFVIDPDGYWVEIIQRGLSI
uniref:lactoylglutathione lyase n=1 Tax=Chromera velia CCMP2878 TaxID=1169474 RepID=A0A0G4FYH8_9ALVE|mmetsp:Transcript_8494/g.16575  ORF Transcript_8494/g.16575 Transcript_8494/m.16575 type:complete len:371 (-) Transcript_8494:481-1593(-)|eukprot:Cvel_19255.t1-p1 / transcript=Cvel_19255.t1 / gene=Cvel_19255 / organism=Chromera_velia_CCMP2878 / gene_product=Lactoylglutathione lyase, putative / transcript_product=Lactoylglutathione lyase, putative / location=Cvel_scaffold1648:10100-13237(-) / protein_length=370 / sequence_SO=supercontig / SO=protein_coding / is_pseudo=false